MTTDEQDDKHEHIPPYWCRDKLNNLERKIDKALGYLEGNGEDGLRIKVDRLEQAHKDAVWAKRAGFAALIGVIIKWAWELATHYSNQHSQIDAMLGK